MIDKIVCRMLQERVICPEERVTIEYGLRRSISSVLGILLISGIGLMMQMVGESLMFILAFIPLRIYAGGYHSETSLKCAVFSLFLILLAFIGISSDISIYYLFATIVFDFAVIFILAPVQNARKKLDDTEQIVYRKRSRYILFSELMLFSVLFSMGFSKGIAILSCAWSVEVLLLLREKVKQDIVNSKSII